MIFEMSMFKILKLNLKENDSFLFDELHLKYISL